MKIRTLASITLILSFGLLHALPVAAQGGGGGADCEQPPPLPPEGSLPPGFEMEVFATGLSFLATSAWDNQGRLYVGEAPFSVFAPSQMVWVLEDTNGDGAADVQEPYAGPFGQILGLAFRPRLPAKELSRIARREQDTVANLMRKGFFEDVPVDLYVNHNFSFLDPQDPQDGFLTRVRDLNGDGDALDPGETEDLITDLPTGADHNNDHIAVGPDGHVYFGIGIRTNWGGLNGPDGHLAGFDCLVEEEFLNGTIVKFDPDGGNLEVVACGFRNPFGIAFLPEGTILSTDNGPDQRNCFPQACAPDELNVIHPPYRSGPPGPAESLCMPGGRFPHYGATLFHGTPPPGSRTRGPIHEFPPSISADGLDVNLTDSWCGFERWAFVAEFGNFGNFPQFTQGLRLEAFELHPSRGVPRTAVRHDFGGQIVSPTFGTRVHPVDAKFGPDDALYVTTFGATGFAPGSAEVLRIFPVDSDGDGTTDICEQP